METRGWVGPPIVVDGDNALTGSHRIAVSIGIYRWQSMRGWELPTRGKHHVEPGDIYIGSIWSCVSKWFLVPRGGVNTVVTNGFLRLRLKEGNEDLLLDIVVGLCSEALAPRVSAAIRRLTGWR